MSRTDGEDFHYTVSSSPLLPHSSEVKMSSSMYVRPLKTTIYTHTKQETALYFYLHISSTLHLSFTHFIVLPKCHARGR